VPAAPRSDIELPLTIRFPRIFPDGNTEAPDVGAFRVSLVGFNSSVGVDVKEQSPCKVKKRCVWS